MADQTFHEQRRYVWQAIAKRQAQMHLAGRRARG